MLPLLGLIGPVFSAIGNIAKGYFEHKMAKVEANRQVELAEISAQVETQQGSWKDEWVTVVFTVPLVLGMFGWTAPIEKLFAIMALAPGWYQTVISIIVTGSFGMSLHRQYTSGKLEREITWDRHEKNGKTFGGNEVSASPSVLVERVKGPMDH